MKNQREGIAFRRKWLEKTFGRTKSFLGGTKTFGCSKSFFSDIFQNSIVPVARQLKQNPH